MEAMIITDLSSTTYLGDFVTARWSAEASEERIEQAPEHRHHACREGWYVLKGSLGFRIDGEEITAPAGTLVIVEPGEVHTFWNASDQETDYLIFMTPKTQELVESIHSMEDRSWPALKALFVKYDAELL